MNANPIDSTVDRDRQSFAQQMITAFFVLSKTARMYESNNDSYQNQTTRFFELLHKCMEGRSSLTIQIANERLFVDKIFLTIDHDERMGSATVLERWEELGVGGLVIGDSITREHIDILVRTFWSFSSPGGDIYENLISKLADLGVDSISLMPRGQGGQARFNEEHRRAMRHHARNTFFHAITTVTEVMALATRMEPISDSCTRRVIHSIIDQISDDDAALVELASIKDYDDYTYAHSTNVCIYSLTIGFRLGLSRQELSELGYGALFHDIGKVKLPSELINKPGSFDEHDWVLMRTHPVHGAMTIARGLKLDPHMARATAVAFEHHINPDFTGYPTLQEPRPVNLYSRIVSIADNFDALTSGRIYIKRAFPPDEALSMMLFQMQSKFDPFLLKLFVNIIGIYPVGSLALLSNGCLALVTHTNQGEMHRPVVRVIADAAGQHDVPKLLDLADPANRAIDIIRLVDAKKYGLDLTRYKLSD
jgi:HD-GYP domain-containing protein (c-di-GMP phosphodiesterase class II)